MAVKYFRKPRLSWPRSRRWSFDYMPVVSERDPDAGKERITPLAVRDWLARLRLLEGVPFNTIVADSELLPRSRSASSISTAPGPTHWCRARSASAPSTAATARSSRRSIPPSATRSTSRSGWCGSPAARRCSSAKAAQITGLLLRSRAVSGWPGAAGPRLSPRGRQRRGRSSPNRIPTGIKLLRLERLAPAVLLALFDGVPEVVHIEEPRQGVQFGVKLEPIGDGNSFKRHGAARATTFSRPQMSSRR